MSPIIIAKTTADWLQLGGTIAALVVGAFGIGANWGGKEFEPQIQANTVAIDSMRTRGDSVGRAIQSLDNKVDRVLCYIESQVEGFNQIRCAR